MNLGNFLYNTDDVALYYDDEAMKLLANEMYANQKQCAWSSIELYDKYLGYSGQLVRKQLFTKLVTSLGNDVIVLNIEGCASIVAPPSHPDTILTTLTYMQKSLTDMGIKYIHLSMDMQLFAVTKQVCWNQPNQIQNVIAHPGGMHIIQSFIGCIGKLMKNSGLEVYVAAAYGGLTGKFDGTTIIAQ